MTTALIWAETYRVLSQFRDEWEAAVAVDQVSSGAMSAKQHNSVLIVPEASYRWEVS